MKLFYTATRKPISVGDHVTVYEQEMAVAEMLPPLEPGEGKITFRVEGYDVGPTYSCSVLDAEWV